MKLFTKNEYSPLKSVIIGRPDNAHWPAGDIFFDKMLSLISEEYKPSPGPIDKKVIQETRDDLFTLIDSLKENGIEVYRPDQLDMSKTIVGYKHTVTGMHNYNVRDILLSVGNKMIECPTPYLSRQHEYISYQTIKQEVLRSGGEWIVAPIPPIDEKEIPTIQSRIRITERYPVFNASNIMKFNDKLLYLISNTANYAGAKWLQQIVGNEFEVITWDKVHSFANIDNIINPLNNNTILINAESVPGDNLPKFLKSFKKIWIHNCYDKGARYFPYASKWIGMSTLSIDPETVYVESDQIDIIKNIRNAGFKVISDVCLRHSKTLGGGLHSVTCDLEREL